MFVSSNDGARRRYMAVVLLAALGASVSAMAQAQTTEAPAGPAPAYDNATDIVVTAQKRSESVNRVGLTITAVTGDSLVRQGITSVADLSRVTPGFTFATTTTSTPVYTLRGVGFYEQSLAAYPAVSVYVDEVPLPFPALTGQAGLDLERVEVLKGPQGILFGQNSTGGAINYIAAKPTDTFKAGVDLGYARFGRFDGSGFVSGPLGDTLAGRVAFKVARGGAWQKSITRPGDELGKARELAGRILLDWKPSDTLKFELNVNGWKNKSDPQAAQYFDLFRKNVTNKYYWNNAQTVFDVRVRFAGRPATYGATLSYRM